MIQRYVLRKRWCPVRKTHRNKKETAGLYMKFIEDDFDLDKFKRSFQQKEVAETAPKKNFTKAAVSVLLWLLSLILAFITAYLLFRAGQYLIDMLI